MAEPTTTERTLRKGERLSRALDHVPSTRLDPVMDPFCDGEVPSWRSRPAPPEWALHGMASRVGGFPPALPRYFIAAYSEPGDVVLDPFCGKGTVLLEAGSRGRVPVGADIAPDAVILSRAKCAGVSVAEVANYIQGLKTTGGGRLSTVPDDVALFYSKRTLRQLLAIRRQILEDMQATSPAKQRVATFVCGVSLGILHGTSPVALSLRCNQSFAMSPRYVRRFVEAHGLQKPERDVRRCLMEKAMQLLPGPRRMPKARVYEESAANCHAYMRRARIKAHLVVTSPPYLNRQTYLRDAWLRLWFLGRDPEPLKKKSFETSSVVVFTDSMTISLDAMWQAMASDAVLVLVCGCANIDVRGKKRVVHTRDLCLLAAERAHQRGHGFRIEAVIRDRLVMKRGSYFAVHHGRSRDGDGNTTRRYGEDDILVMRRV